MNPLDSRTLECVSESQNAKLTTTRSQLQIRKQSITAEFPTTAIMLRTLASRNLRPSLALGLALVSPATSVLLCEDDKGNSLWDAVLPKNSDGSIGWDKVSQQVGEGVYWDKLAKQAGLKVQGAIDSGIPTSISYGFVSGFCSGYAMKKAGKVVAVVLGMGFMSLQTLSYYGYIKVDHKQMERDFNNMADLNQDGKIDAEDGKIAFDKLMGVLEFNLPAGGGFAAGFVGGLRSG